MNMPARTGPFRSRLGHEGDGQAIGHGDLLRSMFEQDGAIGRFERIGVVDVDFVLGDRRFTFGELDRDPGGAQFGAESPVVGFGASALQELVILVVDAEPREVLVSLGVRRFVGFAKEIELEFGRHLDRIAERCGARDLLFEQGARRDIHFGSGRFFHRIAEDHRRLFEPGNDPERRPIRPRQVIAVPARPGLVLKAVRGIELHIGCEQVGTKVGAVRGGMLNKEGCVHAFADKAALQIGGGRDDGVDHSRLDETGEFLEREHSGLLHAIPLHFVHFAD